MTTQSTPAPPPVTSLSAPQVRVLLKTIRAHQANLNSAHDDARLLAHHRLRPAYVIDFDLIYRYIFEYDRYPDWPQEFEYLLRRPDTAYIIGPGTLTEIDALRQGIDPSVPARQRFAGTRASGIALARLHELLSLPNVETAPPVGIDDSTFALVMAAMDRTRRGATDANRADALNTAAVVYLRRNAKELELDYFPYLLTGTKPLLNEESWDPGSGLPVSRDPGAAIYSQVLTEAFPDPAEAMRHTIEMSLKGAQAEHELKLSAAYMDPGNYAHDTDWERTLSEGSVTDGLRHQLQTLTSYVHDPVVYRCQRVYDNAHRAAATLAQQRAVFHDANVESTPRRLFDLIAAITAALALDNGHGRGIGSLWSRVLHLERSEHVGYVRFELFDQGSGRIGTPYVSIDVQPGEPPLYVMRWSSSLDAANVVHALSDTFADLGVEKVELSLCASDAIYEAAPDIPVTLEAITASLATSASNADDATDGNAPEDPGPIRWLRLDSPDLDLYADLTARVPQDAQIGLFAHDLRTQRFVTFFAATSARYVFATWLREALIEITRSSSDGKLPRRTRHKFRSSEVARTAAKAAAEE